MRYFIFFNPLAGSEGPQVLRQRLSKLLDGNLLNFKDVTTLGQVAAESFFSECDPEDRVILAGGDGTLNHFVNTVDVDKIKNKIYLYASGNGNDFYNDIYYKLNEYYGCDTDKTTLNRKAVLLRLDPFLKNLPKVTVMGKTYKFINGVGYGIDGYCCEVGDRLKRQEKKVNYTSIAIKGLLFHFKPVTATVTVDGVTQQFKKVWIAPTMFGRFYGGGMMPTPDQERKDGDKISLCVMYGKGRLGTLMAFPSIFKGEHVKKQNMVKVLTGKKITVQFDRACALQIDGETILNVTEYTAEI